MHMLQTLAFTEAHFSFHLHPQYINTKANMLADSLSQGNLPLFFSKVPDADQQAYPLPATLVDLLLDPSLDWTSPLWHQRFRDTFGMDSLPQPDAPTTQL